MALYLDMGLDPLLRMAQVVEEGLAPPMLAYPVLLQVLADLVHVPGLVLRHWLAVVETPAW
ncbi:hypothetical protein ACQCLI_18070 [Pseudomonas nitroreducens]|uniref:hypothetical protein n=1 Tax=Pseudomonas nitroreducens TaxID=46680 RepID=UPI000374C146|nr:hypothetical protein [Pseudomonas nitroreducens]